MNDKPGLPASRVCFLQAGHQAPRDASRLWWPD